jgi:hypothetical protein
VAQGLTVSEWWSHFQAHIFWYISIVCYTVLSLQESLFFSDYKINYADEYSKKNKMPFHWSGGEQYFCSIYEIINV